MFDESPDNGLVDAGTNFPVKLSILKVHLKLLSFLNFIIYFTFYNIVLWHNHATYSIYMELQGTIFRYVSIPMPMTLSLLVLMGPCEYLVL